MNKKWCIKDVETNKILTKENGEIIFRSPEELNRQFELVEQFTDNDKAYDYIVKNNLQNKCFAIPVGWI